MDQSYRSNNQRLSHSKNVKEGDVIQLDYNEKKDEITVSVKKKKPAVSSKKKETED